MTFSKWGDFFIFKNDIFLKEDLLLFYSAQIAKALQHLHNLGFSYRHLKPENILIDEDGYIKLSDFGSIMAIRGTDKENNFAGIREYNSPEMITFSGHGFMPDWGSFSIIIYELLYCNIPFFNLDKKRMNDFINNGSLSFPKFITIEEKPLNFQVSDEAKSLVCKLLEKDSGTRLENKGLKEIKKHPFFNGINFDDLIKKNKGHLKPKISIDINSITSNFDEEYLNLEKLKSYWRMG